MQNRDDAFDARAYDPYNTERDTYRDLPDPDRDAVWTASHRRRSSMVAECLIGLGLLACLAAAGTQHLWGPWLGMWGGGD